MLTKDKEKKKKEENKKPSQLFPNSMNSKVSSFRNKIISEKFVQIEQKLLVIFLIDLYRRIAKFE